MEWFRAVLSKAARYAKVVIVSVRLYHCNNIHPLYLSNQTFERLCGRLDKIDFLQTCNTINTMSSYGVITSFNSKDMLLQMLAASCVSFY